MNTIIRLEHFTGKHRQTHPTRKFSNALLLEKLTLGVGSDSRSSTVSTVAETRPHSEGAYERLVRRYRWYRPCLVG